MNHDSGCLQGRAQFYANQDSGRLSEQPSPISHHETQFEFRVSDVVIGEPMWPIVITIHNTNEPIKPPCLLDYWTIWRSLHIICDK